MSLIIGNRKDSALIVGADGIIGRNLAAALEASGKTVWQTTRHHDRVRGRRIFLDLSQDVDQWPLPPAPISTVIFCAAVTSLESCRLDPVSSRRVNVVATITLAKRLIAAGVFVVFISTNQVFDGETPFVKPANSVSPRSEYGRQKAEAESQLLSLGVGVAIIRLGKVIHSDMPLFQSWITDLKAGRIIRPFSDMVFAPISLAAAVSFLFKIAQEKSQGIFHLSGPEDITYAEAAYWIARTIGVKKALVQPTKRADMMRLIHLPKHTTLATDPVHRRLGPTGWDALKILFKDEGIL